MNGRLQLVSPYSGLAPFYDLLVGDAAIDVIWRAFRTACRKYGVRYSSAADLGCGTGRFLARLAAAEPRCSPLYGVDRSAEMLAVARRRAPAGRVRLLRQDLRSLALPQLVGLLTCNFDTLNYLRRRADLELAFQSFARNLSRNGYLIFDMLRASCPQSPSVVPFRQNIEFGDVRAIWTGAPATGGGSTVVMNTCSGKRGRRRCWREIHRQRWWPLETVLSLLRDSGLHGVGVHRLPGFSPQDDAGRWVQIVARRR